MKRVLVAGATGLIGSRLLKYLIEEGLEVRALSRSPEAFRPSTGVDVFSWKDLTAALAGVDAVINLAGEGLGNHRWTRARKQKLRTSRVESTSRIVAAMREAPLRPTLFINASAIGFYGNQSAGTVDETGASGTGFLAELCQEWEAAAAGLQGVRIVRLRLGVVLAREGGALPRMCLPLRCFAGCRLGDGSQGLSWIHIEDLVALIGAVMRNPGYEGAINATSPGPVSSGAFTGELARRLHRPLWPLPAWMTSTALRLFLGEMAQEMLLQGSFVLPRRALELGYVFRFPDLEAALSDLLRPVRP
jgi:uncharacterized protein (TIGR01777 family)